MKPQIRRTCAALSLGLIASGALVSLGTTTAGAVVTDNFASAYARAYDNSEQCETSSPSFTDVPSVPWSDNGVRATNAVNYSATVRDPENPADTTSGSGSAIANVTSTPLGGAGPAQIVFDGSASASASAAPAGSVCAPVFESGAAVGGGFTLPAPMFVTISVNSTGSGGVAAFINSESGEGATAGVGDAFFRGSGTSSVLLPAGKVFFRASVGNSAGQVGTAPRSRSVTGRVVIDLKPVGFSTPTVGKARKLVLLGERNCAAGGVIPAVVTKSTAKRAKSVTIKVTGKKAITLKGKKLRKRVLALAPAPGAGATVKTTVVLKKKNRKVTATRSYLGCS